MVEYYKLIAAVLLVQLAPVGALQAGTVTANALSPAKPILSQLVTKASLAKIESGGTVIDTGWRKNPHEPASFNSDFYYLCAGPIHAPQHFSRPMIVDFQQYQKQVPSVLKKVQYDAKTKMLEIIGEVGGYQMHSVLKVDDRYWDEIGFEIVAGDMVGTTSKVFLFEKEEKTLAVFQGVYPMAKKRLPAPLSTLPRLFSTLAQFAIDVATSNFKRYIEDEYKLRLLKARQNIEKEFKENKLGRP